MPKPKTLWEKFVNATIGATIAESPAVATASGWKQDKNGNWKLKPDEGSKKLADNLAVISTFSPTNPGTAIGDAMFKGAKSLATNAVKRFPYRLNIPLYNKKPNALNLHFQRLKNGGYDKLERLLLDHMTNNPSSSGSLDVYVNSRIGTVPFVRKNLRDKVSIVTPENSNAILSELKLQDAGGAVAFASLGMIEYSPNFLRKKGYNISRSLSHELDHALHIPLEKPEGFNLSKLSLNDLRYFREMNSAELAARGSLIKDWLKFNKADLNITGDNLKNAALNYIKETGMDNGMTQFFNSISNYEKAAEWLSKYATMLAIPVTLNKNE